MSFFVLRKCSANSSALSNKIDLIACQEVFVFIQMALENAVTNIMIRHLTEVSAFCYVSLLYSAISSAI